MKPSRYVVGLDLGTTNNALAYVDTALAEGQDPVVLHLPSPLEGRLAALAVLVQLVLDV